MVYNKIVFYIFDISAFSLLKIYDGPGPLSPQITLRESRVEALQLPGLCEVFYKNS